MTHCVAMPCVAAARSRPGLLRRWLPALVGCAAAPVQAQDATERLPPVVVTTTRTAAAPFDVPASIDRVGAEDIRDRRPQVNISESLGPVPGVIARDRQNYAQDVQISVRGPWDEDTTSKAANALADEVVTKVSGYVDAKIKALDEPLHVWSIIML